MNLAIAILILILSILILIILKSKREKQTPPRPIQISNDLTQKEIKPKNISTQKKSSHYEMGYPFHKIGRNPVCCKMNYNDSFIFGNEMYMV